MKDFVQFLDDIEKTVDAINVSKTGEIAVIGIKQADIRIQSGVSTLAEEIMAASSVVTALGSRSPESTLISGLCNAKSNQTLGVNAVQRAFAGG